MVSTVATNTLIRELRKRNYMEAVPSSEVSQAVEQTGKSIPLSFEDAKAVAQRLNAQYIVSIEVPVTDLRKTGRKRQVRVGVVVQIYDNLLKCFVNGAAEYGCAEDLPDSHKSNAMLLMDGAESASGQAAKVILNHDKKRGHLSVVVVHGAALLDLGSQDGIALQQEFHIVRNHVRVGLAHVTRLYASEAELKITMNWHGIMTGDPAIPVFTQPKLKEL
jgi:hypothetical protein